MTDILDPFDKARLQGDSFDRARAATRAVDTQLPPEPVPTEQPEPVPTEQPAPVPTEQPTAEQPQEEGEEEPSAGLLGLGKTVETGSESLDTYTKYSKDIALMSLRGVEGAVEGVYNFLDYISGDRLWDWDRKKNSDGCW